MNRWRLLVAALWVCLLVAPAFAQPFRTEQIVAGSGYLFAGSAPGDDTRLFVMTQAGVVRIYSRATGQLLATPFLTVPVQAAGEAGLLGLAFHPDYAANGYFYVYHGNTTARNIVRYRVSADPNVADPASATLIWRVAPGGGGIHFGGWIGFGPDGLLHIAWGNGGTTANSSSLTSYYGKMLRIDINGPDLLPGTADDDGFPADADRNYRIPPTNPFAGVMGQEEIWAYGLRNPFRCSFDRETGDLWIGDVGDSREEIDLAPAGTGGGRNYGYPCMDGTICRTGTGCVCNSPLYTAPIHAYQRVSGAAAVIGGYVYRGCALPELRGRYIFGDYGQNRVWSFRAVDGAVTGFTDMSATPPLTGIRSFGEDNSGELYICAALGVYRLVPVTPDCNANGLVDGCEITAGAAPDVNHNFIIDSCEHPWPCNPDYNQDGDIGADSDIEDFFRCLAGNCCPACGNADFNGDGEIGTDLDIEAFFRVIAGSAC